jgi:hypothetical protein
MSAPSNATGFGEVGPIVFFDGVGRRAEISNPPGDADGKAHIYEFERHIGLLFISSGTA